MAELRFDDRVVIVTGAGNGLGRSHAHLFASRGAKVVVNDLGGSFDGKGASKQADVVVKEIKDAGGEAVANYDSVTDGDKIVQTAIETYGRVDVVVNNAGILRDKSFHKMTNEDWDLVFDVHVKGAQRVTHAAWPHMREAGYGRVLFTTSAAGLYGNFGQANYAAAKLALVGFSNTLAVEGMKRNIQSNVIAPIAGSRMTETIFPPELIEALRPEFVSPVVSWLCHEDCETTSGVFEVGGGFHARVRLERSLGKTFRLGRAITPEGVQAAWETINDFADAEHPREVMPSMQPVMANVQAGKSKGGNALVDVDEALGYKFKDIESSYDARDVALYALGVGAAQDPTGDELRYVYEMHPDFCVLPSFGVIPAINTFIERYKSGENAPGMNYGFERILHGEQRTELLRPMAPAAKLVHKAEITDIVDKGKNALVVTKTVSHDDDGPLIVNTFTAVVRGAGDFGVPRSEKRDQEKNVPPDRAPDVVVKESIPSSAALLYRLSGDVNPLHADPQMASMFGYERPILHGLCTYGIACRHAIAHSGKSPEHFKAIEARFSDVVFPGDELTTEIWKEDGKLLVQCRVDERVVLSRAAVEFYDAVPKLSKKKAEPKAAVEDDHVQMVFDAIGAHVAAHPELKKIDTIYCFQIDERAFTIDLKAGAVASGDKPKASCTLALSEADFLAMVTGEADPQQLFMSGKLKIAGDVMASQKLSFLQDIKREQPSEENVSEAKAIVDVASLLAKLDENKVKALSGTVHMIVDGASTTLGKDGVQAGAHGQPDLTIGLDGETLAKLAAGDGARVLYQRGDLRVDGDFALARALDDLFR